MRVDLRVLTGGTALVAAVAVLGLVTTTPAGATTPAVPPSTATTTRPAHATVTASPVHPGQTAHVNGTGFRPGETVNGRFTSPRMDLGSTTANSAGDVNFTFPVPAERANGSHTVVLFGETSHNSLTIVVEVAVTGNPGAGAGSPANTAVLSDTGSNSGDVLILALATLAGGLLLLGLGFLRREHLRLLRRGKH